MLSALFLQKTEKRMLAALFAEKMMGAAEVSLQKKSEADETVSLVKIVLLCGISLIPGRRLWRRILPDPW